MAGGYFGLEGFILRNLMSGLQGLRVGRGFDRPPVSDMGLGIMSGRQRGAVANKFISKSERKLMSKMAGNKKIKEKIKFKDKDKDKLVEPELPPTLPEVPPTLPEPVDPVGLDSALGGMDLGV